jgi:hypothetical protein
MNIKRGLIRLWLLFSTVWSLSFLGLSAPDWYHAASYWYRSRGFEVEKMSRCDVKPWAMDWSQVKPPPGFTLDDPSKASDCFHVALPNTSRYLVVVAKGKWTVSEIRDVALYNPAVFPKQQGHNTQDYMILDLTHGNPAPDTGGLLILGNPEKDHVNLEAAKAFTIFAFGVPIGVLVLGIGVCWVVMGFKT